MKITNMFQWREKKLDGKDYVKGVHIRYCEDANGLHWLVCSEEGYKDFATLAAAQLYAKAVAKRLRRIV